MSSERLHRSTDVCGCGVFVASSLGSRVALEDHLEPSTCRLSEGTRASVPDFPCRFDKWLRLAEEKAKLPKLPHGLWHPYRRKWATERKHLSLKDVAAAGGWKSTTTLLECYQ